MTFFNNIIIYNFNWINIILIMSVIASYHFYIVFYTNIEIKLDDLLFFQFLSFSRKPVACSSNFTVNEIPP